MPDTNNKNPVPEFIDPVFSKTIPKRSVSVIEKDRLALVFAKNSALFRYVVFLD